MKEINQEQWILLHQNNRYRPKYPSETVVQFVLRNFNRNGTMKILDLGCGAGRHISFLENENFIPYGVDFSDAGVLYTKEMLKKQGMEEYVDNICVSSLTTLPYADNFFDGIICYGVLYYLDEKSIEQAVCEMERVLKQGGKLLLVVRTIDDYRYSEEKEIKGRKNTIFVWEENEEKCAHSENGMLMHFFEEDELKHLFSNFKNVNIDYIKETHNNQQFCDCNFILTAEK